MIEPVKKAFGIYLEGFYDNIVPTTKSLQEYVSRGHATSIGWAKDRLVDDAEAIIESYYKNDTQNGPTQPPQLPVIIAAMDKNYTPSGRDYTRQVTADDNLWVILPDDIKKRAFDVKVMAGDIRAQLAIFSHTSDTARSIAAQFLMYADSPLRRRFNASYKFAGHVMDGWPVQIETPNMPASNINTDSKNMTILAIDITLHASIPLFGAPKDGDPNDGKGIPGTDDPAGHPVVVEVVNKREDVL
ncbi:hypothetical protein [Nitrosomonas marina]|uniref:Uncharacterized protein n=1 Tax=Nitrosomonas marina TaxID=917 RepID=A0A1H8IVK0_9PROT|nr:hypothetical protein [Nitrosomonas marina]SEN72056.1 hypothetical protein SAMN05216325_1414 [Nitrosomonas marina]